MGKIMKKLAFVSTYLFVTTNLSSCNWHKCKAEGQILVQSIYSISIISRLIYPTNTNKVSKAKSNNALQNKSKIQTAIAVINSDPIIQPVIDRLKLENQDKKPLNVKAFRQQLKVSQINNTNKILVSYRDSDATRAKNIVNILMEIYIEESINHNASEPATFSINYLPKPTEKIITPRKFTKEERKAISKKYWQEIEEMNQNSPLETESGTYQSHDAKIIETADSFCSKL